MRQWTVACSDETRMRTMAVISKKTQTKWFWAIFENYMKASPLWAKPPKQHFSRVVRFQLR